MFLELINYNVIKITIFLHGRREARHLSDNLGKWPASHKLGKSPHCLLPYIHVWNFEKDQLEDLELVENVFQFYLKQVCQAFCLDIRKKKLKAKKPQNSRKKLKTQAGTLIKLSDVFVWKITSFMRKT